MSIEAEVDDSQHQETVTDRSEEIIIWLKVIARILASMDGSDENEIYEDIE